MNRRTQNCVRGVTLFALAIALTSLSGSVYGQDPVAAEADDAPRAGAAVVQSSRPAIDIAVVEAQLKELTATADIGDAIKSALTKKFEQALTLLRTAQSNRQRAEEFHRAIQAAPDETTTIRRQKETLAADTITNTDTVEPFKNAETISAGIDSAQAELATLEGKLATVSADLGQARSRPVEIAARRPEASSELTDVEGRIAATPAAVPGSPASNADRVLLLAQREALASEVDMLIEEAASQIGREDLLTAQRELLDIQVERARNFLVTLQSQAHKQASSDASRLTRRSAELVAAISESTEDVQALGAEVEALAVETRQAVADLDAANRDHDELAVTQAELSSEFERIKREIELGGLDGSFAQILVEQRRRLPNPRAIAQSIEERGSSLSAIRLAGFRIEAKLDEQSDLEARFANHSEKAVLDLLSLRRELLEQLLPHNRTLINILAQIDTVERSYRNKIIAVRRFLYENLFWKQSSPSISAGNPLSSLPDTLDWTFSENRFREIGLAIRNLVLRHSLLSFLVAIVAGLLLASRRKLWTIITDAGKQTHRISTDRYAHTLRSLAGSFLLALPIPLVIGFLGWGFTENPQSSDWLQGTSRGLTWSSLIILGAWFLFIICKPDGLAMAHFGWRKESNRQLRRCLLLLVLVYLPPLLVFSSMLFENQSLHLDGLGRLLFIAAHVGVALILWKYLNPSSGIFAKLVREFPNRAVARFRFAWYLAAMLIPIALIVLACRGYMITALALSLEFLGILSLIASGVLLYNLVLRWFMIKERKLALEEALARRDARREAAAEEGQANDEKVSIDVEESELDLTSVGLQTRRLLRSLFSVGVALGVWLLLTHTLPLDQFLGEAAIAGGLSFLDILQAVLIAAVFSIVVRNLPGLLELGGLRSMQMEVGVRYAITTICQYVVSAIGLLILFETLKVDWSAFGWIATALSVGLGFGLQEIVANFVCGIILLFERPIRVGDIVTVNDVTGTVTMIRMRATTITDWDRKEYVVPNKQFVTDTLKNWTLSNSISRLLLPIGVAYGSDTERARQILIDVARDHPLVLDEPPPSAVFEAFADSTLNLTLRCFLSELDYRVRTISELNTEIDRRFKKAKIEIAFPQQDLHVRSVSPEASQGFKSDDAKP